MIKEIEWVKASEEEPPFNKDVLVIKGKFITIGRKLKQDENGTWWQVRPDGMSSTEPPAYWARSVEVPEPDAHEYELMNMRR